MRERKRCEAIVFAFFLGGESECESDSNISSLAFAFAFLLNSHANFFFSIGPFAFTGIFAANPEIIQEICAIACCLHVTQDAVERMFSALRFILSDYRGNLGDKTLDSILFLRMNKLYD